MKKKTKVIIGLAALCVGCCTFAACSASGRTSPYPDLNGNGYSVSVHYDPNGGQFSSTDYVSLTDVYPLALVEKGIVLVEPGSASRTAPEDSSKTSADIRSLSSVSRSNYFLAGWYRERSLRTDEDGNPIDEDGNLCSESGKAQGYIYSGRWNFEENEILSLESLGSDWEYSKGEYALTLYAAWIPNFTYAYYEQTEDGWTNYATYSFNPENTESDMTISLPQLDDDGVAMVYSTAFPQATGKTFLSAYTDQAMTEECEETISHLGEVDYEHGVSVNGITKCYTTWKDGVWYNIYTAQQFIANTRLDGCYEIFDDLDFTGLTWKSNLSSGTFTGQIIGYRHKLENITIVQSDVAQSYGGLFGRIGAAAVIKDVSFVNVSYTLKSGSRITPCSFGLFTGELSASASIENVSVSGTFSIGTALYTPLQGYNVYNVGILSGNLETKGIEYDIKCETYQDTLSMNGFTLNEETGEITIS